jgi:hypothetical protein
MYVCMYVCSLWTPKPPNWIWWNLQGLFIMSPGWFCQVWCKSINRDPPHGLLKIPCYSNELLVYLQKTYDCTQNFKTLFYIWLRFDVVPHFSSRLHHTQIQTVCLQWKADLMILWLESKVNILHFDVSFLCYF